jgi:hypothetical protein
LRRAREAFIPEKRRWVARMAGMDRSERLKAALRENLKRRKAQARGREANKKAAHDPEAGVDLPVEPERGADPGGPPSHNPAEADEE